MSRKQELLEELQKIERAEQSLREAEIAKYKKAVKEAFENIDKTLFRHWYDIITWGDCMPLYECSSGCPACELQSITGVRRE